MGSVFFISRYSITYDVLLIVDAHTYDLIEEIGNRFHKGCIYIGGAESYDNLHTDLEA